MKIIVMKFQTYLLFIYFIWNVVCIPRCIVKVVQDVISSKTVRLWLRNAVKGMKAVDGIETMAPKVAGYKPNLVILHEEEWISALDLGMVFNASTPILTIFTNSAFFFLFSFASLSRAYCLVIWLFGYHTYVTFVRISFFKIL